MSFSERILKIIDLINFKIINAFIIVLGITIRLYHYLMNRSLWLDEAMLSNNIINKSYLQLLHPLDDRQIAPIGFLMVQKFLISTFGISEYSLRLFPTLAGIFSIIFLYLLFKKLGGEKLACAGLLFFIFAKLLIYHSTEAKQYYMDVFALILSYYYLYFNTPDFHSIKSILYKGLLGALLIWFSHCTILFLTSIGLAISVELLYKKDWRSVKGFLAICAFWLISFGINYYFFLYNHSSQTTQESAFMSAGYLPPEGALQNKIAWYIPLLKQTVTYPLNINTFTPLIILILLGLWYVIINKQFRILALILPFLIHIVLSLLYLYPFGGRFNIYFGTVAILFIAMGLKAISAKVKYIGLPVSMVVLVFILYYPAKNSFRVVEFEEMKPALKYIQDHKNDNDVIYIHYASRPSYQFYNKKYPMGNSEIIEGTYAYNGFEQDFHLFENKDRVWVLLSHWDDSDIKRITDKCKEADWKLLERFEYNGGLTLLYSFSK